MGLMAEESSLSTTVISTLFVVVCSRFHHKLWISRVLTLSWRVSEMQLSATDQPK